MLRGQKVLVNRSVFQSPAQSRGLVACFRSGRKLKVMDRLRRLTKTGAFCACKACESVLGAIQHHREYLAPFPSKGWGLSEIGFSGRYFIIHARCQPRQFGLVSEYLVLQTIWNCPR
jgi:hypothetical protein